MAVYIEGKAECGICHRPIVNKSEIVACPAFVSHPHDELYPFSDAVFHESCFNASPHASEVKAILEKLSSLWQPANRCCEVCHQPMSDPDDHFGTGYLTKEGPLSPFNFRMIHKSCLSKWKHKEDFGRTLQSAIDSGSWGEAQTLYFLRKELVSADA